MRTFTNARSGIVGAVKAASPTPTQLVPGLAVVIRRAHGLDADVRGKQEEARGDQLLRPAFGSARTDPPAGEEPDDDEPGEGLDQAVGAEPDQGDRACCDSGAESDRELDRVPADSAPGEQSRPSFEPCACVDAADRQDLAHSRL